MTQAHNNPEAMPPAHWQGGPSDYPRDTLVHVLFEAQAAATPDAIALVTASSYLTYAQLNTRADELARHLLPHAGAPIALCLDRSPELIITLLAILKAGACYVPLDPAYPPARLESMAQDSTASLLITTHPLSQSLPNLPIPLLFLEDLASFPHASPEPPSTVRPQQDQGLKSSISPSPPAYIMFTSGSTGRPKGVVIPHRAIVRLVRNQNYLTLGPAETFLQFAPASFDASTLEIWAPLLNGGRLAIAPPGQLSLDQIATAIRTLGVTSMWLTSGLFNLMADQQLNAFAPLRQLLAGGDILSIPHLRKVAAAHPNLRLINGYGPTETTTFACCHTITVKDLSFPSAPVSLSQDQTSNSSISSIPLGRPISNTLVRILDPSSLAPTSILQPGELFIGGDGLALGYLNQPALTAEKFIQIDGQTFYRTGDRVRWLPDGLIEFLGRQDHQVKIRGYRIELGEIESLLALQSGVHQCAIIALGEGADKQLIAYHTGPAEPATLRDSLRRQLPDYMVPSFFTALEALPLTPNGKLDRARLPSPLVPSIPLVPFVPSNDLEKTLATLWSEVLPHPAPGLHDNFFDIGGTSLKLVEAHARLVRALHRQVPVTALFQYPTIASLAAYLAPDSTTPGPIRLAAAANRARMQREALARKQLSQNVP